MMCERKIMVLVISKVEALVSFLLFPIYTMKICYFQDGHANVRLVTMSFPKLCDEPELPVVMIKDE